MHIRFQPIFKMNKYKLIKKGNISSLQACILCNFVVYGMEFNSEFLKRWSVSGIILPAAVHNPGDFHGAAMWSRHTVSWSTSQRDGLITWFLIYVRLVPNGTWTQTLWQVISECLIRVVTFLHLFSCLLIAHAGVGRHSHGEGLPQ